MLKLINVKNLTVQSPRFLEKCIYMCHNKDPFKGRKSSETFPMAFDGGIVTSRDRIKCISIWTSGICMYRNFPTPEYADVQADLPLKRICNYKVRSLDEKRDDELLLRALSAYGNNTGNEPKKLNPFTSFGLGSQGVLGNKMYRYDKPEKEALMLSVSTAYGKEMFKTDKNHNETNGIEGKISRPIKQAQSDYERDFETKKQNAIKEELNEKRDLGPERVFENKIRRHHKVQKERAAPAYEQQLDEAIHKRDEVVRSSPMRLPNKTVDLDLKDPKENRTRRLPEVRLLKVSPDHGKETRKPVEVRKSDEMDALDDMDIESHPKGEQAPFPSFAECVQNGLKNGRPIQCDCSSVSMQRIHFTHHEKRRTYDSPALGHYWRVKRSKS